MKTFRQIWIAVAVALTVLAVLGVFNAQNIEKRNDATVGYPTITEYTLRGGR